MTIALYTNIISPHQVPFAKELIRRIGAENFRYVFSESLHADRISLGWDVKNSDQILMVRDESGEAKRWLNEADIVISGIRALDLFEARSKRGKKTFYSAERWFKPLSTSSGMCIRLPGILRMLVPSYRRMAKRMVRLLNEDTNFHCLPIGVWAREDMARLGVREEKMTTWGYFVEPGAIADAVDVREYGCAATKVLWVGRMLRLKNVDVLIRAVKSLGHVELTLVGDGPEKYRLMKMAGGCNNIVFLPPVAIDKVREIMRAHNVYVFPSNEYDGWGAVVSEAMEEGMIVLGSNQAGAPATMLPESHRFDCWDYRRLAQLLRDAADSKLAKIPIGDWSATKAAERFLEMCK